jgi:hypothetical protein
MIERGPGLPRIETVLKLASGTNSSPCALLKGMGWRLGRSTTLIPAER